MCALRDSERNRTQLIGKGSTDHESPLWPLFGLVPAALTCYFIWHASIEAVEASAQKIMGHIPYSPYFEQYIMYSHEATKNIRKLSNRHQRSEGKLQYCLINSIIFSKTRSLCGTWNMIANVSVTNLPISR